MVRTQIQLPDELYERVRKLAKAKELSLAELARRGLEHMVSIYPPPQRLKGHWTPPKPRRMGWRGLSHGQIKDAALDDVEQAPDRT